MLLKEPAVRGFTHYSVSLCTVRYFMSHILIFGQRILTDKISNSLHNVFPVSCDFILQLLDSCDVTTRDSYSGPFNIEEQIIQEKSFALLPTSCATNSPFSWHPPVILRAVYDLELAVAEEQQQSLSWMRKNGMAQGFLWASQHAPTFISSSQLRS